MADEIQVPKSGTSRLSSLGITSSFYWFDLVGTGSLGHGLAEVDTVLLPFIGIGTQRDPIIVAVQHFTLFALTGNMDMHIIPAGSHIMGWGKVGEARFILDRTNDAGFRPLEHPGEVLAMRQLGDRRIIIYASNGISTMVPVAAPNGTPTWHFETLSHLGIRWKDAVCGNRSQHYFLDAEGSLCRLSEQGIESLDYQEFLAPLDPPVLMFYDEFEGRVYISNKDYGFIYEEGSGMGAGWGSLTGLVCLNPTRRFLSHAPLDLPVFELVTNIIDFGYRGQKTLESVQLGTGLNIVGSLSVAYDFRYDQDGRFWRTTHWQRVNREGVAYLKCAGIEFRIRVRSDMPMPGIDLDYINVQYKVTDRRFLRSRPLENVELGGFAGSVTG